MPNNVIANENPGYRRTSDLFIANDPPYKEKKKKTRLLVQKGLEHILLRLEDIVLLYTENKVVYVIDRFEKKYMIYNHLSEIEEDLDPLVFFSCQPAVYYQHQFYKKFQVLRKSKN